MPQARRLLPATVFLTWLLALQGHGDEPSGSQQTGITDVSHGKLILTTPPDRSSFGSLRYALAFPFQADPNTVGLMVMRMIEETSSYGFLDGSDIILINELGPPRREQIFAASRNEVQPPQP